MKYDVPLGHSTWLFGGKMEGIHGSKFYLEEKHLLLCKLKCPFLCHNNCMEDKRQSMTDHQTRY